MAKVIAMGEDCSHNLVNNLLHYSQHLHQDLRLKNEQRTTNNVTFPKSEQKINRKFQRQRNTELNTKYCLDCVNKTWKKNIFHVPLISSIEAGIAWTLNSWTANNLSFNTENIPYCMWFEIPFSELFDCTRDPLRIQSEFNPRFIC